MGTIGPCGTGAIVAAGMTVVIGILAIGIGWLDPEPWVDAPIWVVSILTTSVAIGAIAGAGVQRASRERAVAIGIVAGACWVPVLGLVFLAVSIVDAALIDARSGLAASMFATVYLWALATLAWIVAAPIGLLWAAVTRWVGARQLASVIP